MRYCRREVRSIRDIDIPHMDVKEAELKLAKQLIDQQTSSRFDPSQYTDEVRERIETAVQKKVEGQEITLAEAPEAGSAKVIDLMEALRASLAKKGGAPAKGAEVKSGKARKGPKAVAALEPEIAPKRKSKK